LDCLEDKHVLDRHEDYCGYSLVLFRNFDCSGFGGSTIFVYYN
jgi:hypothetical protein